MSSHKLHPGHIINLYLLMALLSLGTSLSAQSDFECCCGDPDEVEVPGGDFEFDPYPNPGGWIDYSASFGPWDVSTGSISHHDDGHNNLGAGNPNPSTAHVDLNGFSTGGICQDISGFEVGQECTIIFFYAIHNGISSGSADLDIDGGSALSISWDATNVGSSEWLEASYEFIATNETMDVCFTSQTFVGCCGMLIDDIAIFCCQSDQEDPSFVEEPADLFFQCLDDVPEEELLEAEDDCSEDLIVEFNQDMLNNGCTYTFERVWTVEDECGNTYSYQQNIEVLDNEDPQILVSPTDLVISCSDDLNEAIENWIENFGNGDVVDNCEEVLIEANYDNLPDTGCFEEEVSFVFSDECGNSDTESAYIVFEDGDEPEFEDLPQSLVIDCGENADSIVQIWLATNGYAQISDICDFEVTNDFDGILDASEWVNFTAVDMCGNIAMEGAIITLNADRDTIWIIGASCNPLDTGYVESLISGTGPCDSLIIQDISFLKSDTSYIQEFICNLDNPQEDTLFLMNTVGCDSVVYISKIPINSDTTELAMPTCDPDMLVSDTSYFQNAGQCDSLVITNYFLTENDTLVNTTYDCDLQEDSISYAILPGQICDTVIVDQILVAKNDTINIIEYECDLTNVQINIIQVPGPVCDSIFIIETIPLESDIVVMQNETCRIQDVGFDSTYHTNADGCDSLVIEEFIFNPIPDIIDSVYDCEISVLVSDTINITGVCDSTFITVRVPALQTEFSEKISTCRIDELRIDTIILINSMGCDSLYIEEYVYDPIMPVYKNQTTCNIDEVGLDTLLVFGAHCDSTYIIETTLLPPVFTELFEESCDADIDNIDTLYLSSLNGCDSLVITHYEWVPLEFGYELDADPCSEFDSGVILFENLSGGVAPYTYSVDGISFSDDAYFSSLPAGEYYLSIMDGEGCMSETIEVNIQSSEPISSSFGGIYEIEEGSTLDFELVFSSEPDSFYWSHPELVDCPVCTSISISPEISQALILYMVSKEGCISSDSIELKVKSSSIFIPNIFTPGQGQVNDDFKIYNSGYVSLYKSFRIYNRWGNIVFELSDIDGQEIISWDGSYNDVLLNPDVFVYQLIIETKSGKEELWHGTITLLR